MKRGRRVSQLWTNSRQVPFIHETGLVMPRKGALRTFVRRALMTPAGRTADITRSPEREVLSQAVFPEAAARRGNILFVGTQAYTKDCPARLESMGGLCWTIDCDPDVAGYGSGRRHVVGSVCDLARYVPDVRFRTILLCGVLGFGVNKFSDQVAALSACANVLEPNGFLVLSWNANRVHAGVLEEATSKWFDFRSFGCLPSRIWVQGCDHNFAFFRKSSDRVVEVSA